MIERLLRLPGIEKPPRCVVPDRVDLEGADEDRLRIDGVDRRLDIRLRRELRLREDADDRDWETDDLLGADRDERALRRLNRPSTVGASKKASPTISATVAAKRSFL